jgi:hypothetical protein
MRTIRRLWLLGGLLSLVLSAAAARAATKIHVITFGQWTSAPWMQRSTGDGKPLALRIRALLVDGRVKEYVIGSPHEVTDRLFVVRRAFRVNDSLPEETGPRWQWQRGGWLVVDRTTGRVSPINLPEFDALYSVASWYRDYVAYCGVSDDGKKISAIVIQLGRRKPVLNKPLSNDGIPDDAAPDSACPAPAWQRNPVRLTFEPVGGVKQTFVIRGHVVDVVNDGDQDEDGSE